MYDTQSRKNLENKLDYERWVLEFLYEQSEINPTDRSKIIIKPNGALAHCVGLVSSVSQSRVNKILVQLYPLIFAASYKNLDMQFEWILEENNQNIHLAGFERKISMLEKLKRDGSLQLPPLFASRHGLYNRLFGLYKSLKESRNSVIHDNTFEISSGDFEVSDGSAGTYTFTEKKLFAFARSSTISANALIQNALDSNMEREIKTYLDSLNRIHQEGLYDITPPWSPVIEVEVTPVQENPVEWKVELDEVWEAFGSISAEGFFLLVKGALNDGTIIKWEIPSDVLTKKGSLDLTLESDQWGEYRQRE